ncbi:MAG: aminodeoxychorismate/anthranilate synthase component II [Methylococcales bacterium]|nr:aminodeoxychorismate/anthranilate synthase component II [Methylococcales bacterium]MCK5925412.1 aminodeoxychorismate/anthranilate synthase component II [Methylococcales bacterium]
MTNTKILLIDNYDSFTFNLQHLIAMNSDVSLTVKRNDDGFIKDLENGVYSGVVIGPGPGSPEDDDYFGFNKKVILNFGTQGLPILGVCLGFQGIYNCFGGSLKIAELPMHGKVSNIKIIDNGVMLNGVPNNIKIMRYHSILADLEKNIPESLQLTAYTQTDVASEINGHELMALEHREHPIYGLQFHPESFATEYGGNMIENFITKCKGMA